MSAQKLLVGRSHEPVLIIDDTGVDVARLTMAACALAPFPPSGNYYPGLRQPITSEMPIQAHVSDIVALVSPLVFDCFDCTAIVSAEPSLSMVTLTPDQLSREQQVPHFDSPDPNFLAMIVYLSDTANTGTAFFRQRSTGIERVCPHTITLFLAAAGASAKEGRGYPVSGDEAYEQIGAVGGVPGRVAIYRGGLLHSGMVPPGMTFSEDPREGRLTLNVFMRVSRG